MHHRILPIPCRPYSLNWLPERLIVSHYENNYGAAVQSLNALRDRLASIEPTSTSISEIRALRREELSAMTPAPGGGRSAAELRLEERRYDAERCLAGSGTSR
jgi:hypothetical protein